MAQLHTTADRVSGLLIDEEKGWRHKFRYGFQLIWRDKSAMIGLLLFMVLVVSAVLAPWIAPHDPLQQNLSKNRLHLQLGQKEEAGNIR
jgi:ABC-type antimicrobial peptide transport system permease subunit